MRPSLTRNITANWIALVTTGLAGLLVAPVVIRALGQEAYGTWAIIVAITSQCMIFDFGIRNALVKFVSECSTADRRSEMQELLSSAMVMLFGISALLFGACLIFSDDLPYLVGVSESLVPIAATAFTVAALDACFELLSGVAEATLAGRERYDVLSLGNSLRAVVNAVLLIPVVTLGGGMIGIAICALVTRVFYRMWLFVRLKKELPELRIRVASASIPAALRIVRYGAWAFLVVVSTRIVFSIDILIVGYFCGPIAAGMYSVCVMVVDQIRQLAQSGTTVLTPRLSAMESNAAESAELLLRAVRILQVFAVLIVLPLLFTRHGFLLLFAGPGYDAAYPALLLLVLPFTISLPAYLFTSYLYALARHELTARLFMMEAVINLGLSLLLVKWLGPVGVAVGTFVPAIIFRGFLLPRQGLRVAGLSSAAYRRELIWRPLPAAAVLAISLALAALFFDVTSLSGWLITNCLAAFAFSIAAPKLLLSAREQRSMLTWLTNQRKSR